MLFISYLNDRKQFVQVNTYNSELTDCLKCSVIQGSKLLSLLYILYTNEITNLNLIMQNKEILSKVIPNKYKHLINMVINSNTDHLTVNYIDDSTNLISHKNEHSLINFLTLYYCLLKQYTWQPTYY